MKTFYSILSIALMLILTGCTTSDEAIITPSQDSIGHTWTLKRISGGLAGIDLNYSFGEVTWSFNEANQELNVQNNIVTTGPEDVYAGYETGTYSYEIVVTNGESVLFIENMERGIVHIENNQLDIDNGVVVDGLLTEFEKVNP